MRKIDLYINGSRADFSDDSFILLNYGLTDLANPAVVKNSFSREVELPGTASNLAIFSHFGKEDRLSEGAFNPYAKYPFSVYAEDGSCLVSGYTKLNRVKKVNGRIESYAVTLYGGLGSLLYGLQSDASGNKLTLADLQYEDDDTEYYEKDYTTTLDVQDAWASLDEGRTYGLWSIFNFAPMYNGLPESFDADKAVVKAGIFANCPGRINEGGTWYYPRTGQSGPYMLKFASKHTEWEMPEIRSYLQRPCVNVVRLLTAISNSAITLTGKAFVVDNSVWSIPQLDTMWMSLPLLDPSLRSRASVTLGELLKDTMSPADFLIGFAKAFGLVFRTDPSQVTLMARNAVFAANAQDIVDLTKMVDISKDIEVTPVYADNRFYDFAFPGVGAVAEEHKKAMGQEYRSVRVDTQYPFNETAESVLEGIPFKASAHLPHQSDYFISEYYDLATDQYLLPQSWAETVQAQMFKAGDYGITGEVKMVDLPAFTGVAVEDAGNFSDWLDKFEAESADRKAQDGSGILMFYNGMQEAPYTEYDDGETYMDFPQKKYYFTGWDQARVNLNEGVDCWDLRRLGNYTTALPNFSAVNDGLILAMADTDYETGLFTARWKNYIVDLYNKETARMKCSVDLRGLQVGEQLLGRFYWYGNAIWVMNAINNHSLTTEDTTEVELVRVQDMTHYSNGQN